MVMFYESPWFWKKNHTWMLVLRLFLWVFVTSTHINREWSSEEFICQCVCLSRCIDEQWRTVACCLLKEFALHGAGFPWCPMLVGSYRAGCKGTWSAGGNPRLQLRVAAFSNLLHSPCRPSTHYWGRGYRYKFHHIQGAVRITAPWKWALAQICRVERAGICLKDHWRQLKRRLWSSETARFWVVLFIMQQRCQWQKFPVGTNSCICVHLLRAYSGLLASGFFPLGCLYKVSNFQINLLILALSGSVDAAVYGNSAPQNPE